MRMTVFLSLILCILLTSVRSVPKTTKLSDQPHDENGEHNVKYDHEAFLGKDTAAEFDALPLEESKRRLKVICDKIDKDSDGFLTHEELTNWVKHVSHRHVTDSAKIYFVHNDKDNDDKVSWDEYKKGTFGIVKDPSTIYDSLRSLTFEMSIERDNKRFKVCDQNKDGYLDQDEYTAFTHPESFDHTKEVHLEQSFLDMDKNNDGSITIEEYIEDIWPTLERGPGKEEPEWVISEKKHFSKEKDKDGNGKLDKEELKNWIAPDGYDPAIAEASHLIHHADSDKDKKLSIKEVIENHSLFVGSHATEFGDYLKRHDEF